MSGRLFCRLNLLRPSSKICSSSLKPSVSSYSHSTPAKPRDFFAFSPLSRSFAASRDSNSNVVIVGSADELKSLLKKTRDDKLPSVFYFYNIYCGPCEICKPIHPAIERMGAKYPHVTFYKVDLDKEGIDSVLNEHRIRQTPVFCFHKNGKKVAEEFGFDIVEPVESTVEKLYKQ